MHALTPISSLTIPAISRAIQLRGLAPGDLVVGQTIQLEAWIGVAAFIGTFMWVLIVPLFVLITQSPRLLRDRHYGLFALVTFTWSFSLFTLGWVIIPMIVAIWFPYPQHP